jgi:hypothetical protein
MSKEMSILSRLLLGSLLLLASGTLGITHSLADISHTPKTAAGSTTIFDGVIERLKSASTAPLPEPADAVLIRRKEWQWHRYLKNALNLPVWLDLGLENRTRFEVYDHPWRTIQPTRQTDPQIQQRSRVRFGLNGGPFRFLFEGQDSRVHLSDLSEFAFVNTAVKNEYDILQVFISATARNAFGTGLRTDLHFGRLTLDFGSRRLIARNDFRNTTNAFDGVHWQLAQDKVWRIRAFLVEPVIRDTVQLDEQSQRFVFWGTYLETDYIPWLRLDAYYFGLNDKRFSTLNLEQTSSTLGLRLYKNPEKTEIDYEIESVGQTGSLGNTDHFAHFQHINLGYSFDLPWSPRFLIHYDYASGDRHSNDSQSSAFNPLFGARRFEYTATGSFGPFFRSNISSPGWRIILVPVQGWKFQVKQRFWYLATSRGAFAGSGLRDATGESGNYLGHDVEVRVQWKVNENVEFDAGYDHWFKGSYFDRLPASAGLPSEGRKDTDYFYILTTFRL